MSSLFMIAIALCTASVAGVQLQVCESRDCTSCQSYYGGLNTTVSAVLSLESAYIICGSNISSIYGVRRVDNNLRIYHSQTNICQSYMGGSYMVSCDNEKQVVDNITLGQCHNGSLSLCEPGKLLTYRFADTHCVGSYTIDGQPSDQCPMMFYGMCAYLRDNVDSLLVAISIFPLFLGLCFSVYASLPCFIFCNDDRMITPQPQRDVIIARATLEMEVQAMMNLNGPASPSTVSEYSSSTFRGNAILLASCLMTSTNLLLLSFIANSIAKRTSANGASSVKWLRTISYLLISVVGFFPSAPPAKIRKRTPALWCSFGSVWCDGKFDTSIIQNIAHMCSFFLSIILFIASEFVEYGGREAIQAGIYNTNQVIFSIVLIIFLILLIVFQAPVNIARSPLLSFLQCGFMNSNPTKREKKWLNACAAIAFFIEVALATCLICFGLYEELLPISICVDIVAIRLFPWIIVVCSCVIGYGAGFVLNFWRCLKEEETPPCKNINAPVA